MPRELLHPTLDTPPDEHASALLLVGHGTREPTGIDELRQAAAAVDRRTPGLRVEACFLEFAEPTIPQAIEQLVASGASEVVVAPLLLFAAGHASEDIPGEIRRAAARFPDVVFRQAPHLGCHPRLVQLSTLRYRQALAEQSDVAPDETLLLMVGRGSRDPRANAEMAQFARLRWESAPVGWYEVCYKAMTEPSLPQALDLVAAMPFRRVVVQPHLLFRGRLLDEIHAAVAARRPSSGTPQWLITQHLGVHDLLVDAIVERAKGAAPERNP